MTYVDLEGTRLHVQDVGEGTPVVLVSGFGLDHQLWDRQVRVLVDAGHRVLCVDQRGHGLSDKPACGYAVASLVRDLAGVLEHLEIGPATVVGHSFGGQVAFGLAASTPVAVRRLVLVGSNAVRASRSEAFPFGRLPELMVDAVIQAEMDDRLSARVATIASGFGSEPDRRTVDWLVGISLQMPSWAAVACYRSMLETDQLAALEQVTQPVLQVIGETDPVHSAKGARWLNERLADATLVELPACGHYPMLESAARFDEALLAFAGA
jgi:pimeloyl-ACP methyl ester carboxylesterase